MTLAVVHSRSNAGINALPVTVEVHLSRGLPGWSIVGLPQTAVKESKDRVRSAILNSGLELPPRKIIVSLAPADLPKEGGRFDLAIAIGILAASNQIPKTLLDDYEIAGELALTGELRAIKGALPFALAAKKIQRGFILPISNKDEAILSQHDQLFAAQHLLEVCAHLKETATLKAEPIYTENNRKITYPDLAEVKGQIQAKRALTIAAAGRHSVLLTGPPGAGKTMLSSCFAGLLPEMSNEEALEVAALYSISSNGFNPQYWKVRPFRTPHHTSSDVALVGGGRPPKPGEISLAHHGVLFLDELPEFNRSVLEALREPLESKTITISRASHQAEFPAHFQFIAAMNPCPCGYATDTTRTCSCTQEQIQRYQSRLSGPLLDRIDLFVTVQALPTKTLIQPSHSTEISTETTRKQVSEAFTHQYIRAKKPNASLTNPEIQQYCHFKKDETDFLEAVMQKLNLSARAYYRMLKVARTIADLESSTTVNKIHLSEALSFRRIGVN